MTLHKQNISLRVGGGMMEDVDDFLLDAPMALDLVNVRFDRQGTLSKRKPQSSIGSLLGASARGYGIVEHRDALVAFTPTGAQAYTNSTSSWSEMNERATRMSAVRSDSLVRTNGGSETPEIAKVGDYVCVAWVDRSNDELRYFIYHVDAPTVPTYGPTTVVTLGANVEFSLIGHGDRFAIAFADGVNVRFYICNPASAFTFSLQQTFALATAPSSPLLCPGSASTHVCLAFNTFSTFNFRRVNLDGSAGTAVLAGPSPSAVGPIALAFISGSTFTGYVALSITGEVCTCNTTFSSASEVVTISTTSLAGTVYRGTIAQTDAEGGYFCALSGREDQGAASLIDNSGTLVAQLSAAHAVTRQEILPSVVLVGRAISLYSATNSTTGVALPCGHIADTDYPFGVLIRPFENNAGGLDFAHAGTFLVDALHHADTRTSGAVAVDYRIPGHIAVDDEWWLAHTVAVADVSTDPESDEQYHVDLVQLQLYQPPPTRSATAQTLRLIGGGAGVVCTDGVHVAENTPPPLGRMRVTENSTGGAVPVVDNITYFGRSYTAFWRWRDASGNVHRGPIGDSVIVPQGTAGAANYYKVIMRSPMPAALNGDRGSELELEWYGMDAVGVGAGDGKFHFVDVVKPEPDPARDGWMFCWVYGGNTTTASNFVRALNQDFSLLYTEQDAGSELEPQPIPPIVDITSTQSRVWILPAQDRLTVRPSKPLEANRAPEFASELDIRIPEEGGDCVAIASLGNAIAVFKESSIYTIFGEPGGIDGSGATVGIPERRVADIGCVNPLSVVEVLPLGVAFQSQDGLVLLTPSGEVQRVGEAVRDALGDRTITSGVAVPEEGEIRWTVTTNGDETDTNTIVWDYRRNAWSRWTGVEALHSCLWRGVQARILSDAATVTADSDTWADASHEMSVTIPWLKFAGVQGLQRVYRAIFLLRWYTGGIRIAESIDYDDAVLHTHRWLTEEDPALSTDPIIDDLAAENDRVQVSIDPLGAKCESMKFAITERYYTPTQEQPDPTYGRGFELIGIDVIVGMKRGGYRHKQVDGGKA